MAVVSHSPPLPPPSAGGAPQPPAPPADHPVLRWRRWRLDLPAEEAAVEGAGCLRIGRADLEVVDLVGHGNLPVWSAPASSVAVGSTVPFALGRAGSGARKPVEFCRRSGLRWYK